MKRIAFFLSAVGRPPLSALYFSGCLLIGPVLLIVFPGLPFANDSLCDEWYVFGLFHHLPEAARWWSDYRQPGRFAQILPGFLLTRVLPGTYSDYAQFLLFFELSTIFIFKALEALFSTRRAALAAIFFSTSPLVVALYGVTVDAPIITYETLSLFAVARALTARSSRSCLGWMLLSGLGWGAALNAHLASASFGAFSYLFFAVRVLLKRNLSLRSKASLIGTAAVVVTLGVILLHVFLAMVAALMFNASPSIILNQYYEATRVFAIDKNSYWISMKYFRDSKVGFFLLGLAVAGIYLFDLLRKARLLQEWTSSDRHTFAIAVTFIVSFGLWFAFDMLGAVFLQVDSYYVMMWPFLTLTIFAGDLGWDGHRQFFLVLFFAIACLLCLAPSLPDDLKFSRTALAQIATVVAIGATLLGGLTLKVKSQPGRTMLVGGFLSFLAFTGFITRPWEGGALWLNDGKDARRTYARLHAGLDFTLGLIKESPREPVVWTNENETPDGTGFEGSFLYCEGKEFPEVDLQHRPASGDFVVALARPQNLDDRLEAAARTLKIVLKVVDTMTLKDDRGPYRIVVLSVTTN
jgi:hypothetical protein